MMKKFLVLMTVLASLALSFYFSPLRRHVAWYCYREYGSCLRQSGHHLKARRAIEKSILYARTFGAGDWRLVKSCEDLFWCISDTSNDRELVQARIAWRKAEKKSLSTRSSPPLDFHRMHHD
jgi:hypothetical protein